MIYVGVSTKAYLGYAETLEWLEGVRRVLDGRPRLIELRVQPFVIPSAPLLAAAREVLAATPCWIGAQDAHWTGGAATGAVSPDLLAELGVTLVEVGHAERRRVFGDTEEIVARKTAAILGSGLTPLLCIGEAERSDAASAARACADQVRSAVGDDAAALASILIAYEPWWAIGAAEPAAADYVNDVLRMLKVVLADELGVTPRAVLYGGSAGPGTLGPLTEADGLFLGRFAHDPRNLGLVLDEAAARATAASSSGTSQAS